LRRTGTACLDLIGLVQSGKFSGAVEKLIARPGSA